MIGKLTQPPDWFLTFLVGEYQGPPGVNGAKAAPAPPEHPAQPSDDKLWKRVRAYLDACEPAIDGANGSNQAMSVANALVIGFSLSDEESWHAINEGWNQRCKKVDGSASPWSHSEWMHKCASVRAKSTSKPGYLKDEPPHTNGKPKPATPAPVILKKPTPILKTRRISEVVKKPILWLWPWWIPLGKTVMLDGDPGLGKSTLLLDIAARVSTDGVMPDGSQGAFGSVLIMSAEDADDDTIRPRLEAAGADLSRIHSLSEIDPQDGKGGRPLELPADLSHIEEFITKNNIKLLIIDPLMAFLTNVDASKDQDVRRALYRVRLMAERTGCTIICLRHLNKGSSTKAIYRGMGSIGITGAARTALIVAADPDEPSVRILAAQKVNLGPLPESRCFTLDPVEGGMCRIGWHGTSHHTANDLTAQPPTEEEKAIKEEAKTKKEVAKMLLQDILAEGPLPVKECKKQISSAGISVSTIERAAKELGIQFEYIDGDPKKGYNWRLPETMTS